MKIYWKYTSLPELKDLALAQRGRVWRACVWRSFLRWQTWAVFAGQVGFALVGAALGAIIDYARGSFFTIWFFSTWGIEPGLRQKEQISHGPIIMPIYMFVLGYLGMVVGGIVFTQVHARLMRPYLKKYLETHSVA